MIADASLAPQGERKIEWVSLWMPVLNRVREGLVEEGVMRGRRVGIVLPVEPKTAYLAAVLAEAGAETTVTFVGSMVHDDVAAGLAARGVEVYARSGTTHEEELQFFDALIDRKPEVVIDDRADVIRMAHSTHPHALDHLLGAAEETNSGVVALRAMDREGLLKVPCIATNDARCKYLFDNRYGSGQSTVAAVFDATNLLAAGKTFVVVGYGWVGKGIARRARGLRARVIVCEVDPFAALEAVNDGFEVMQVADACERADVVMTATGVRAAVDEAAIERLRDGAILANAGAVDDEFDVAKLHERAHEVKEVRRDVVEYRLDEGRSVFVVGNGQVVNLTAGEGHGADVMDLTFAAQALAARHLLLHAHEMPAGVVPLPAEIDESVARMKLDALGIEIDALTPAQQAFLQAWEVPA